jgi:hypothetical protein
MHPRPDPRDIKSVTLIPWDLDRDAYGVAYEFPDGRRAWHRAGRKARRKRWSMKLSSNGRRWLAK